MCYISVLFMCSLSFPCGRFCVFIWDLLAVSFIPLSRLIPQTQPPALRIHSQFLPIVLLGSITPWGRDAVSAFSAAEWVWGGDSQVQSHCLSPFLHASDSPSFPYLSFSLSLPLSLSLWRMSPWRQHCADAAVWGPGGMQPVSHGNC